MGLGILWMRSIVNIELLTWDYSSSASAAT